MKKCVLLTLFFFSLPYSDCLSQKVFNQAVGDWDVPANWTPAGVPTCGQSITIPAGKWVTVQNTVDLDQFNPAPNTCSAATTIDVYGTLDFNNGGTVMYLACGSQVRIYVGGTFGSAPSGNVNRLYICNNLVYKDNGCAAPCASGTVTGSSPPKVFGDTGLPVELTLFKGAQSPSGVSLFWSTASELNFDYFDIQKSTDGKIFHSIGAVKGHGTTTSANEYYFEDQLPVLGNNYYRLVSVDFDLSSQISAVILIYYQGVKQVSLFPNPNDGLTMWIVTNFLNDTGIHFRIFNALGVEQDIFNLNDISTKINFQNRLAPGIYFAKAQTVDGPLGCYRFSVH